MTKKRSAQQTAPNADVRVRIRLLNGAKLKREITLPSSYPQFADIVAEAEAAYAQMPNVGGVAIREALSGKQVDDLIDLVYREKDKAARIKNVTAQAGMEELTHALNGMRLYKLRAVGSRRRSGTADNVRIACVATVSQS